MTKLYDTIWQIVGTKVGYGIDCDVLTDQLINAVEHMTELSLKWKQIFDEISTADEHVVGKINYYNLTSILEDLYVENAELKARVEALENDKKQWAHPESSVASNNINFEGCYD